MSSSVVESDDSVVISFHHPQQPSQSSQTSQPPQHPHHHAGAASTTSIRSDGSSTPPAIGHIGLTAHAIAEDSPNRTMLSTQSSSIDSVVKSPLVASIMGTTAQAQNQFGVDTVEPDELTATGRPERRISHAPAPTPAPAPVATTAPRATSVTAPAPVPKRPSKTTNNSSSAAANSGAAHTPSSARSVGMDSLAISPDASTVSSLDSKTQPLMISEVNSPARSLGAGRNGGDKDGGAGDGVVVSSDGSRRALPVVDRALSRTRVFTVLTKAVQLVLVLLLLSMAFTPNQNGHYSASILTLSLLSVPWYAGTLWDLRRVWDGTKGPHLPVWSWFHITFLYSFVLSSGFIILLLPAFIIFINWSLGATFSSVFITADASEHTGSNIHKLVFHSTAFLLVVILDLISVGYITRLVRTLQERSKDGTRLKLYESETSQLRSGSGNAAANGGGESSSDEDEVDDTQQDSGVSAAAKLAAKVAASRRSAEIQSTRTGTVVAYDEHGDAIATAAPVSTTETQREVSSGFKVFTVLTLLFDVLAIIDLIYLSAKVANSGVIISLVTFVGFWVAVMWFCHALWKNPKRTETWYFRFRLLCIARVVTTITIYWVTLCIAMLTSDTAWENSSTGSYDGFFHAIDHLPTSDGHPRTGLCYGVVVFFLLLIVCEAALLWTHGQSMEMSDELATQQLLAKLGAVSGASRRHSHSHSRKSKKAATASS